MKDVANIAGVSVSTVSKYLKNQIQIKEETAQRIDQAIRETHFVVNKYASTMKSGKNPTVGLIFPHMKNMFFADLMDEMYRTLSDHNYGALIAYTYDQLEKEKEAVHNLRASHVSGCILVTEPFGDKSTEHIQLLLQEGVHTILINRFTSELQLSTYNAALPEGTHLIIDHLYNKGIRKIGYILGWQKQNQSEVIRLKNIEWQKNYGVPPCSTDYQYSFFQLDQIEEMVELFIKESYRAIVCITDRIALRVKEILLKKGINIPEEISVISLGDSLYSELAGITSVAFDLSGIGRDVALDLISQIEIGVRNTITPRTPYLIERSTT